MELLGNLLDNAGKWAKGRVQLSAGAIINHGTRIPGLWGEVADDGPGIAPEARERLTQRGVRGDERVILLMADAYSFFSTDINAITERVRGRLPPDWQELD